RTGLAIGLAPLAFIIRAGEIVEELSLRCVRNVVLDFILLEVPGDASGFGNELADVVAVRVERFVFVDKHVLQLEAIGLAKGLVENSAGNFKSDEVVIAVWSVAFPRDFEYVKSKFGLHMPQPAVLIGNAVAELLPQAGIQNRNSSVSAEAVTVVVRRVMRKRAGGESVLIEIFRIPQQREDEIAAADVMREVAEKGVPVRVIAHILNDGAAVGVSLRSAQIFFGCLREFFQQQRLDVRLPNRIDNGFVREDSVGVNGRRQRQQNGDQANDDQASASKKTIHDSG